MRTDLNLVTNTTDGTKKTNKLSYVNSDASNAQLSTLAQKIASLSNDTLTGATKSDTIDISVASQPIPVSIAPVQSSGWPDYNRFFLTPTQLANGVVISFYLMYNQDNPQSQTRTNVYDTYNNNTKFKISGNSPYPISIACQNPIVQTANNKAENYIYIQTNDALNAKADALKPTAAYIDDGNPISVTLTVNVDDDKIYNDGLPISITIRPE